MFSAHCVMMLCICTTVCGNIFDGFEVIEWTRFLYSNFQRGIIRQKSRSCYGSFHTNHHVVMMVILFICTKLGENVGHDCWGAAEGYNMIPSNFLWRGIQNSPKHAKEAISFLQAYHPKSMKSQWTHNVESALNQP